MKKAGLKRVGRACLLLLCAAPGVTGAEALDSGRPVRTWDLGPLASRRQDVAGNERLRILGPFFERVHTPAGAQLVAVRPLFARAQDPAAQRQLQEILWPAVSLRGFRQERQGRVLMAIAQRFDIEDPRSRYRIWVLPFYFQGRDRQGDGYVALFPLGGRIHEFMGQDRIAFAFFPFWARTEVNEVETTHLAWPFFARTAGQDISRTRAIPFYGYSRHRDQYEKRFVLWPVWTQARWYVPGSEGYAYVFFPLWGRVDLEDQQSWMLAPPFFRIHRGAHQDLVHAPWPVVQYASGTTERLAFWPFWGRRQSGHTTSMFALWPLIGSRRTTTPAGETHAWHVTPLLSGTTHRRSTTAEDSPATVVARRRRVWPLFEYRHDMTASRFRLPALWPVKEPPQVERNWAPLWTLYEQATRDEAVEIEALWGLYRNRSTGTGHRAVSIFPLLSWERDTHRQQRAWSLAGGLLGHARDPASRRWRILYLPIRRSRGDTP